MKSAATSVGVPKSREELVRRLEEAEETIRAIREGEIDALVVQGARDDQVFTLHGADYPYRAFMETMRHGAAALNCKGEVLYANTIFAILVGRSLSDLQGTIFLSHFEANVAAQLQSLLLAAEQAGDAASSCEVELRRDDECRHYLASVEPLELGVVKGWALTLTDLTDKVLAEKSIAAERAVRAIIASANEAMLVCDMNGRITFANAAVSDIREGNIVGQPFGRAISLRFPASTGLDGSDDLICKAVGGHAVKGVEAHSPDAPRARDLLISAAPISPGDGLVSGCVVTLVDLSQRKAAEERQNLLMAELDHRVKNTLTLVLAILQTTEESEVSRFKDTFSGRVHALAATHNLLSANSWSKLSLDEVFSVEVAPFLNGSVNRVRFSGPKLLMKPRAAIAIGLVFHELATNAVKYGALSTQTGRVTLSVKPAIDGTSHTVEWLETGGPSVSAPKRSGFGRKVIANSLKYLPGGGADMDFQPSGLKCMLRLPHEDICGLGEQVIGEKGGEPAIITD